VRALYIITLVFRLSVLQGKYIKSNVCISNIQAKDRDSLLWKIICKV
jgi:hypothetical protein